MTEPEKPLTRITTSIIHKLHPKLVTIQIRTSTGYGYAKTTTINLPITNDVYKILLRALANEKFNQWLPLVFFVNEKGVSYKVIPKAHADKEKEEPQEAKKLDNQQNGKNQL